MLELKNFQANVFDRQNGGKTAILLTLALNNNMLEFKFFQANVFNRFKKPPYWL